MNEVKSWPELVTEFHRAGDQPVEPRPIQLLEEGISKAHDKLRDLRIDLLAEENTEYAEGECNNNIVEIADAIGDMIYILIGTSLAYGINIDRVFREIHRSNMTKVVDGKVQRRPDGKILKPNSYTPPDIAGALGISEGWDANGSPVA